MRRLGPICALILLAAPACGDLLDPAAAVVYGEKIPIEDVQAQLDAYVESRGFEQLAAAEGDEGALKREYEQGRLTDFIMRAVLTPAAEERGIEVTEDDVAQRIEDFVDAEFGGSRARLEEELNEQGLTQAEFREIMHDQILTESLRAAVAGDIEASESDIRAFYEENRADFETTHTQHILVRERSLAQKLATRLQAASEDDAADLFARLARRHSIDRASARNAGDLGFQPAEAFGPLTEQVAALEPGGVSDPLRSDSGWHVLRVIARRTAPLGEVREAIADEVQGPAQDEAWDAFLDDLFEEADVEVNPRYGIFDEDLRRVVDPDAGDIPAGEAPAPDESPSAPEIPLPLPPPPG